MIIVAERLRLMTAVNGHKPTSSCYDTNTKKRSADSMPAASGPPSLTSHVHGAQKEKNSGGTQAPCTFSPFWYPNLTHSRLSQGASMLKVCWKCVEECSRYRINTRTHASTNNQETYCLRAHYVGWGIKIKKTKGVYNSSQQPVSD